MKILSTIALALFMVTANAELNYEYIEASYARTDIDAGPFGVDGDGFEVGGSFSIRPQIFGFASFGSTNTDVNFDLNTIVAGVGYHSTGPAHYVAKVFYLRNDIDAGSVADSSDNGFGISFGGRGIIAPKWELEGNLVYVDSGDSSGELGANGLVRYHINQQLSSAFFVSAAEDTSAFGLNIRLGFGRTR